MSFIKRNRIISVRVSPQEYERLEQLAQEEGAFSVSDFVRRLLTNAGLSPRIANGGAGRVLSQIAALQREVERLSHLVGAHEVVAQDEPARPLKRLGHASGTIAQANPGGMLVRPE